MNDPRVVEIIKRIRRVHLRLKTRGYDYLGEGYHSVFKGLGMEFEEAREYVPGDDLRRMDWNVTARTRIPHVKQFREERELAVMLLVDLSPSMDFGSINETKRERAILIAATIAYAAIMNGDKAGLILFPGASLAHLPPDKGEKHLYRLIYAMLAFTPSKTSFAFNDALEKLSRAQKKRTIVFLFSDFYDEIDENLLRLAAKRHELSAVYIDDPREFDLSDVGRIELEDAETGERVLFDARDTAQVEAAKRIARLERAEREKRLRAHAVRAMRISTEGDYAKEMFAFFRKNGS